METTTTKLNLKTEALKNGAIWGAINLVIFLITWYAAPSLMSSYWYAGLTTLIGIALAVFFCLDLRKKAGGYWSFSEALWPIFAMFLTAMAMMFVFNIMFGKYIDQSYPVKMKATAMENVEKMMKSMSNDDASIEKAMSDADARFEKQFNPTFSEAVVGFGIAAVIYFIGALIFTLIFKKSNPNPWGDPEADKFETQ